MGSSASCCHITLTLSYSVKLSNCQMDVTYRSYSVFPLRLFIKSMQCVIAATQASRVFLSWATWSSRVINADLYWRMGITRSTGGMLQSSLKTMEKATSLVTSDSLVEKKLNLSRSGIPHLFASLVLLLILLKMSVLKPSRTSLISLISYLSDPLKKEISKLLGLEYKMYCY